MAWALRTDERPNPNENEDPEARRDYFSSIRIKKRRHWDLVGETAGML
jgi:hypothetical protein